MLSINSNLYRKNFEGDLMRTLCASQLTRALHFTKFFDPFPSLHHRWTMLLPRRWLLSGFEGFQTFWPTYAEGKTTSFYQYAPPCGYYNYFKHDAFWKLSVTKNNGLPLAGSDFMVKWDYFLDHVYLLCTGKEEFHFGQFKFRQACAVSVICKSIESCALAAAS